MSHREGDLPRMTSASWPFFSLCLRSGTLLEIFRLPSTSLMIERIPQDPKCIGACTQSLDHQAPAILWTAINERQSQRTQGSGLQKASPQAHTQPPWTLPPRTQASFARGRPCATFKHHLGVQDQGCSLPCPLLQKAPSLAHIYITSI